MKTRKVLGACTMLISLGALAVTGVVVGVNAAEVDPGDDTDAAATASVDTKELCTWFVTGVADGVVLDIAASETIEEYDGSTLDLDTSDNLLTDVSMYVSGNLGTGSIDTHSACTFYGENQVLAFQAALGAGGFEATVGGVADPDMDFDMGDDRNGNEAGTDPVELIYDAEKGECRSGATGEGDDWDAASDIEANDTLGRAASNVTQLAKADTVSRQSDAAAENSACTITQAVRVSVPADLTPGTPGSDYTFTGPTLTFGFNLDS